MGEKRYELGSGGPSLSPWTPTTAKDLSASPLNCGPIVGSTSGGKDESYVTRVEFNDYCTEAKSTTKSIFACMDEVVSLKNKVSTQEIELRELHLRLKKIDNVMSLMNAKVSTQTLEDTKRYNAILLRDQGQKYMASLKAKAVSESTLGGTVTPVADVTPALASSPQPVLAASSDYQAMDIIRTLSNSTISSSQAEAYAKICSEYFQKHNMPALAEKITGKELMQAASRKRILTAIQQIAKSAP